MTDNQLMMQTGRTWVWKDDAGHEHTGVKSLLTGKWNRDLQKMAQRHAKYQADNKTQGHQLWDERRAELVKILPGYDIEENAAEADIQITRKEAAAEMFHSWRLSPGHWSMCNRAVSFWGIAMVKGTNGIWYADHICAWKR